MPSLQERGAEKVSGTCALLCTCFDSVFADPRSQRFGNHDGPVGLLIVFQDRDDRATDGDGRTVEGVDKASAFLAFGLVALSCVNISMCIGWDCLLACSCCWAGLGSNCFFVCQRRPPGSRGAKFLISYFLISMRSLSFPPPPRQGTHFLLLRFLKLRSGV